MSNLVACCTGCNARKGDRVLGELDTPFTTTLRPRFATTLTHPPRVLDAWETARHYWERLTHHEQQRSDERRR